MSVRQAASGPHGEAGDLASPAEAVGEPAIPDPDGEGTAADPAVRSRRPWVAGALGATWALFVGLALLSCVIMALWALSPSPAGDSGAAWRAVGLTWLGAHQTALQISGLPVTVLPLGAVLAGLLLTRRGGGWSARLVPDPSRRELGALVGGAALAYGAGGAVVAWLSGTPSTGASLVDAFTACAVVAAAGSLWGISRELDLPGRVSDRVSQGVWRTMVAGCAGAVGLFVLGAGLVALSLIVHVADAARSLGAVDGGILAAVGVTLVDILTLPTLSIWAAALASGPGFHLGGLGSLGAFGGDVGALPALPVLVSIPASAPGWGPVLLAGPVACGMIAGRVRWQGDVPSWPSALVTTLGVGVVVAPLVAGAVLLTSGSVGGGALAQVGPELGPVTAAAVGLVLLGFLGEALAQSVRLWWELHRAEQRAVVGPLSVDGERDGAPDGTLQALSPGDADPAQQPSESGRAVVATPGSVAELETDAVASPADVASTADLGRSFPRALPGMGSAGRSRVVWAASAATSHVREAAAVAAGRARRAATSAADPRPAGDPPNDDGSREPEHTAPARERLGGSRSSGSAGADDPAAVTPTSAQAADSDVPGLLGCSRSSGSAGPDDPAAVTPASAQAAAPDTPTEATATDQTEPVPDTPGPGAMEASPQ